MKKNSSIVLLGFIALIASSLVVLADPNITLSPVSPNVICAGGNSDTLLYSVTASGLPSNTNIVIYQSTDSTFNPNSQQGDSIGYIPGNAIPQDTVNFGTCIKTLGIFIDACGAAGQEGRNEYIILTSGSGIKVSNLGIDFSSQNNNGATNADINTGANPCGYKTPGAALISSLRVGSCNASNVIPASPTDSIPANSIILLFTSDSVSAGYSINGLCNLGYPIYILQSACVRTIGAFTNAPRCDAPSRYRTTIAIDKRQNCRDNFTYDLCGIFDEDGTYAIRQQGTDTASVANNGIRRNAIDSCGGIDYAQLDFSADTILKFKIPTAFCNTGYHYLKAVLHPGTQIPVLSNTISFKYVCNDVAVSPRAIAICSGDSAYVSISGTDPNASFSWTVSGGVNITGETAGSGTLIKQKLTNTGTAADSVTYTVTSSDAGCAVSKSVTIKVQPPVAPVISGNLIICNGGSVKLSVSGQYDSLRWNTSQTTNSIDVIQAGVYSVAAYRNGCSGTAGVNVSATSLDLSISGNAQLCNGNTVTLVANGTYDSVRWNTGATGSQIAVNTAGDYTATGYLNGCSDAASVRVVQCSVSSTDTVYVCSGDSVKISGPEGYTHYKWTPETGLSNDTIREPNASPSATTQYVVAASDGAISVDTSELIKNGTFKDSMNFWNTDLFVKTPSCGGCNGWYYIGDITYYCANPDHTPGTDVNLFNSSPTADTSKRVLYQTVAVNKNTNYRFSAWGYAHNSNNAIFNVKINNDIVVNSYALSSVGCVGWENFTGTWFSGNNTTAYIVIKDYRSEIAGNDFSLDDISFKAVRSSEIIEDTVVVVVIPNPSPVITGAQTFCQGNSTTLSVSGQFDSVRWNTGAVSTSVELSQQGTYSVTAYSNGCSGIASVQVSSLNPPLPFTLGNDTAFCGTFSRILSSGSQSTSWNTDETGAQITVSEAGEYIATVTNTCGAVSDTIVITQSDLPQVFIGNDTAFCEGELLLTVSEEFRSVLWNTGAQSSSISVTEEGVYAVRVTDGSGCSGSDTIDIRSNCANNLWLPNAFSPNEDGINDVFLVRGNPRNTTVEKFTIYNRWGNKVFEATDILPDDPAKGWDGKYKGETAPVEVYGYYVVARFSNGEKKTIKGNVTLLK